MHVKESGRYGPRVFPVLGVNVQTRRLPPPHIPLALPEPRAERQPEQQVLVVPRFFRLLASGESGQAEIRGIEARCGGLVTHGESEGEVVRGVDVPTCAQRPEEQGWPAGFHRAPHR